MKKDSPSQRNMALKRLLAAIYSVMLVLSLVPTEGLAEAIEEVQSLGGDDTIEVVNEESTNNAVTELAEEAATELASEDAEVVIGSQATNNFSLNLMAGENAYDVDAQEITWKATFRVPDAGLKSATITDVYPTDGTNAYDEVVYVEINGTNDDYQTTKSEDRMTIFFKDGLNPTDVIERLIQITIVTKVNQNWFASAAEATHTNTVTVSGSSATDTFAEESTTCSVNVENSQANVCTDHPEQTRTYAAKDATTHVWTCGVCKTKGEEAHEFEEKGADWYVCKCGQEGIKVTFDAGEGTGTMDGRIVGRGAVYELPTPTFTAPEGKDFLRWEVKEGFDDPEYYGAGEVVTLESSTTIKALWSEGIEYKDANGAQAVQREYENLTSNMAILRNNGWYVVSGNVDAATTAISVNGVANLILCKGATLNTGGITVASMGTLNIYGQMDGAGTIDRGMAGNAITNYGKLNVYDGNITHAYNAGIMNQNELLLAGGSITGCGVGIEQKYTRTSSIKIKGTPTISGCSNGGTINNICLHGDQVLQIVGSLTDGTKKANLGVRIDGFTPRAITSGFSTYNKGQNPRDFFTCNNASLSIADILQNDEVALFNAIHYWDGKMDNEVNGYTDIRDVSSFKASGWYAVLENIDIKNRFDVASGAVVNLILADGAKANFKSGIHITGNSELIIWGQTAGSGSLVATADGEFRAGIGGNSKESGGKITINGGKISATGSESGAGIGGGEGGSQGGKITINAGEVTATGGDQAAGIGGGNKWYGGAKGGEVEINGGKVTANGGMDYGAGIGGGDEGANGKITINGGTVVATGGNYGAGIGCGDDGEKGDGDDVTITINGGTVTAKGGKEAAGIGGGNEVDSEGNIKITGGTVNATGGALAAGIGGGDDGPGGTITISGNAVVNAVGGRLAAGIGGGEEGAGGTINIGANAIVDATCSEGDAQAIGHGDDSSKQGNLTLYSTAKVSYAKDGMTSPLVVPAGEREQTCRSEIAHVRIEPCEHEADAQRYEVTDTTHAKICWYCSSVREAATSHDPDDTGVCKDCGYISGSMPYIDAEGKVAYATNYKQVAENMSSGWYVVPANKTTTFSKRVQISGTVNLILCDGSELNCNDGIHNEGDNKLVIWCQTRGNGKLNAVGDTDDNAGIGGDEDENGGTLEIYGGVIYAEGEDGGAGIGGGEGGSGGTTTINGGTVTAKGDDEAAGIGGGNYDGGGAGSGKITINGGTVKAYGAEENGAGIGGGDEGSLKELTINGGIVYAFGGQGAAGIGGGEWGDCGNVTITGGYVEAIAGDADKSALLTSEYDFFGACGIGSGWDGNLNGTVTIRGNAHVVAKGKASGSAIGGTGMYDFNPGSVIIEDKAIVEVSIEDYEPKSTNSSGRARFPQLIGEGGAEHAWSKNRDQEYQICHAPLSLYAESKVTYKLGASGDLKLASVKQQGNKDTSIIGFDDERYKVLKQYPACWLDIKAEKLPTYAKIEPCNHDGNTKTAYGYDDDTHWVGCGYCARIKHDWLAHNFMANANHKCQCGAQGVEVKFSPSGGKGSMDSIYAAQNGQFVLPECTFEAPEGASFKGWRADGKIKDAGDKAGAYEGITIIAEWEGAGVSYINETKETVFQKEYTDFSTVKDQSGFNIGTSGQTTWYAATSNVSFSNRPNLLGHVNIILCDGVTATFKKGLHAADNAGSLTIWVQDFGNGKLVAGTEENYTETGLDTYAGIGGNNNEDNEVITIYGGQIVARGGEYGAGIGGGEGGSQSHKISILGGRVWAYGGQEAAGIGGGNHDGSGANGGEVLIKDAYVYAEGTRKQGAGIGGGDEGTSGDITIENSTVEAVGHSGAAGIGGGEDGGCGNVTIKNSNVTATAGDEAAGIGSGNEGKSFGTVIIDNTAAYTVKATGGKLGAGIGTGDSTGSRTINGTKKVWIKGGTVTATGQYHAAGIGGGEGLAGLTCIIDGGNVTATGGFGGAGIGGGDGGSGHGGTVEINSTDKINKTNVRAIGGGEAAGIGSGNQSSPSGVKFTITDGTVYAECSGRYGAGIGGGDDGIAGDVTLLGGTVIAKAGTCDEDEDEEDRPQAIGHGYEEEDNHTIKFGEKMKAVDEHGSIAYTDRRDSYCRGAYVKVTECDHQGGGNTYTKDADGHKQKCLYCGFEDSEKKPHENDEDGVCKICGYKDGEVYYIDGEGKRVFVSDYFSSQGLGNYSFLHGEEDRFDVLGIWGYKSKDPTWYVVEGERDWNQPILIAGKVNIILVDGARLTTTSVFVDKVLESELGFTPSLTIWGQESNSGRLVAYGEAECAGIGGYDQDGDYNDVKGAGNGNITINGGTIEANGGRLAAGIGGGDDEDPTGVIEINGGIVEATGGEYGAGIGGGEDANGANVNILGGRVTAKGGSDAAGIGAGDETSYTRIVNICDGTVYAEGGNYASGIGGGDDGRGGTVYIYGGDVTAKGGTDAAGIGGGEDKPGGSLYIYGGKCKATGGENGAGVGAGEGGSFELDDKDNGSIGGYVEVRNDGYLEAIGGVDAAGIGTGDASSNQLYYYGINMNVYGGTVVARGGSDGAGIGGGNKRGQVKLNVQGGTVTAYAGSNSQAIGRGSDAWGSDLTYRNSITIGKTSMVYKNIGDGQTPEKVTTNERTGICSQANIKIMPCDHEKANCIAQTDGMHHKYSCAYCDAANAPAEDHKFSKGLYCDDCGARGCMISFFKNGASGKIEDAFVNTGTKYTLPDPEGKFVAPQGKAFVCWMLENDSKEYAIGDTVTITKDTEVTAIWDTLPTVRVYSVNTQGTASVANTTISPSTGYYKPGTKVTVSVADDANHDFVGWYNVTKLNSDGTVSGYDAENLVSKSHTYELTTTNEEGKKDVKLVAVFKPKGDAILRINSINDARYTFCKEKTPQQGSKHRVPIGETVTITATEPENVLEWLNSSEKRINGKAETLEFVVTGNDEITLVYDKKIDSQAYVQFISNSGQVLLTQWCSPETEEVMFPESVTTLAGRKFSGWIFEDTRAEATSETIKARSADGQNLVILPKYESLSEDTLVHTIEYKDTSGNEVFESNVYDDRMNGYEYRYAAATVSGYVFNRWEDSNGVVLGYTNTIAVNAYYDRTLVAIYDKYGPNASSVRPVLTMDAYMPVDDNGVHKVRATLTRSIPNGWEVTHVGILAAKDFNNPTNETFYRGANGVSFKEATSDLNVPSATYFLNGKAANDNQKITFRGFAELKNTTTGRIEVYYTDVRTVSYGELV